MADNVSADQLRLFIERAERLTEEKKGIQDDIRDVFSEAKGQGFDPKVMRVVMKLRAMAVQDRQEQDAIIDTYREALGIV